MSDKYILEGHMPKPVEDLLEWATWMETADRRVALDEFENDVRVSTVFLGLNHNFLFESSTPILFETMVFGGPLDGEQERYSTWEQAEKGHAEILARVKAAQAT